jgi:spermidine synthase
MEVLIESAPSDINPHMYVSLSKGRMQLCTENAVYSYEDRYDNFRLLFEKINLSEQSFDRILLLGLGLGSVPLLIEMSEMPAREMTFVELDPQVIYLAEKYTLKQLAVPYTTYCADAEIFVKSHQAEYDLILSDIFLDDAIPDYFVSKDYVDELARLLHPQGLIIMNTLASTAEDKVISRAYFDQIFNQKFPTAVLHHVWENHMLLSRSI